MTVSVCIPATRADGLAAAIRSVREQTWQDWEVIVLGQGGGSVQAMLDATTRDAAAEDSRVRYVPLRTRGLSRARNAALREARGDVIAFLDDDCEASPDWLAVITEAFAADPLIGLVGGAVVPNGSIGPLSSCPTLSPVEAVYDPATSPRRAPDGWDWIGANFAIRASVAARVGAWDAELGAGSTFPAGEDTDYKLRMEEMGIRMLSTPRSVVVHSSGTRSARAALRSQSNYQLGNGALAAKQTLSGDARGELWRRDTRRLAALGWVRRPHRFPVDLRRALWFERGYRKCLRRYVVGSDGLLRARAEPASSVPGLIREALRMRRLAERSRAPITLPVAGGAGALLTSAASGRLTSVLDPGALTAPGSVMRRWLERRQARRSAVLVVPDRAAGMRFAGLWRLDLSRIRVARPDQPPPAGLETDVGARTSSRTRARPWHAR